MAGGDIQLAVPVNIADGDQRFSGQDGLDEQSGQRRRGPQDRTVAPAIALGGFPRTKSLRQSLYKSCWHPGEFLQHFADPDHLECSRSPADSISPVSKELVTHGIFLQGSLRAGGASDPPVDLLLCSVRAGSRILDGRTFPIPRGQ